MSIPASKDQYQWNEAGYFGVRYKLYEGFALKLGVNNVAIYQCILAHTDRKTGYAELSLTDFSKRIGILDRHVLVKSLKTLEQFRFVVSQKRRGKTTRYYPLHDSLWEIDPTYQPREQRSDKGKPRKQRKVQPLTDYAKYLASLSEGERYNRLQQQKAHMGLS